MRCGSRSAGAAQRTLSSRCGNAFQAVRSGDFGGSVRAELLADTWQPAKWPDVLSADCMLRARRSPNVDKIAGRTRSSNPNRCAQWRSAKRHESRLIKHGCADFAITRKLDSQFDIFPAVTFSRLSHTPQVRSCGLLEAPPATLATGDGSKPVRTTEEADEDPRRAVQRQMVDSVRTARLTLDIRAACQGSP
jgi:hypothetical protein